MSHISWWVAIIIVMEKLSHLNGDKQISDEVSQEQAQCAICCPTDIEINPLGLRSNECHHITVTLNCLPGEQKLRLSSKRKRKSSFYFAIKIKFSIYIRFFSDVLIVCRFKNTSFWCTQVQTDYIKDWMYINQSLVSSVSISSSYESCGGCVVKWTSVATNINDRH